MAYFLAFRVTQHKILWLILITIPFWTSYLLRVFAWKVILGFNGVINSGLISLGIIDKPLEFLLYNPTAVVITLAHAWAAFAILPIYVSLEKIDRSLLEAATDLGDGPLERFLRVTLPLSAAGRHRRRLLVFIPTVGDYVTPTLVGGTGRHHDRQRHPVAVRQGQQLAAGRRALDRHDAGGDPAGRRLPVGSSATAACATGRADGRCARRHRCARRLCASLYLVFLYGPVLLLPLFSFNDSIFVAFPLTGFTTSAVSRDGRRQSAC